MTRSDPPQTTSRPQEVIEYHQHFSPGPAGSCQLLLIRHGQSAPYVPGRPFPLIDGHGDPPLTELGHQQADSVALRLQLEPMAAIYVSTLTRTHQTAEPLARRLGLTPMVEPELREVFLGEAEGGRLREMMATDHPVAQQLRREGDWGVIPGAETKEQLTRRTVNAVVGLASAHPDQMVAVFCHGGVINAILSYAIGSVGLVFTGARHTSINHLLLESKLVQPYSGPGLARPPVGWQVRCFNDSAHAGTLLADHPVEGGRTFNGGGIG